MTWFVFSFDNLLCRCVGIAVTLWWTLLLILIIVPTVLGVSIGIRSFYMRTLLKIFKVRFRKNDKIYKPYSNGIIAKEAPVSLQQEMRELRSSASSEFEMADILYFCRSGVETIVDDEVIKCFSAQELESWNLLTRTNYNFRHISLRLTVLWALGVLLRYAVMLPLRVALAITGVILLIVLTPLVTFLPEELNEKVHFMCYRIFVRALTAIITYHNKENKPKNGGICVANHTTPIDIIILANDGCYSLVGQVHGGLMGILQRAIVRASPHIWFERSEAKDRHLVAKRYNCKKTSVKSELLSRE
uniref:Glycerol-3-phosphate acyltransferase 4 n=1 Tax=Neogobius melanostomus TaxID=47308 RepID=A0A8C6T779_9GOBI